MNTVVVRDRSAMLKLELEYAQAAFTTIQKIVETLRKKLIELTALEARRLELEIALLQQTVAQTAEFERLAEKAVALATKCTEMRNPNGYQHDKVPPKMILDPYFTDLYRNFEFCIYHSHTIKDAVTYHRDYSHTTVDALTMPAGCGSYPLHLGAIT